MGSALLLTVDCLRADHVGCYGYDRNTTPNVDDIADTGTTFLHAYANSPGTRWAFQTLHTGIYGGRIRGIGVPEEYDQTLAATLERDGVTTAGWSKNGFVSREWNYDTGFSKYGDIDDLSREEDPLRRFGRVVDETFNIYVFRDKVLRPLKNGFERLKSSLPSNYTPPIPDKVITDRALDWIETHERSGESYFAWLHFMNAHTPYGRWPDHLEAVGADTSVEHTVHPGDEGLITQGEEPPQRVVDTYDAGVRSVDEQIGRLLDAVSDDTTVVVTGDHGEEFGRYRDFHEESLYSSYTQVPLVVRSPSLEPGTRTDPVQHLDVPPTLVTALDGTVPDLWDGTPLQDLEADAERPIFFDLARGRRGIRRGEWKLIDTGDDPELFRTSHGGDDTEDVSDKHPERLVELQELLADHLDRIETREFRGRPDLHQDGFDDEDGDEPSESVKQNLKELGYLE